jgi:uncharacterized protein (DUF1778 family)
MKATNKSRTIAFRVTEEQWQQIERAAVSGGHETNEWARDVIVEQATQSGGMTRNERLLYEEIARVRYLLSQGFALLANEELSPEAWLKTKRAADLEPEKIADALLTRMRQS